VGWGGWEGVGEMRSGSVTLSTACGVPCVALHRCIQTNRDDDAALEAGQASVIG
jgi:hypothetical protein